MNSLFIKKITTLDFSFFCDQQGLIGETWLVDMHILGEFDQQGMIMDFSIMKKKMKSEIQKFADHKLIVPLLKKNIDYQENNQKTKVSMMTPHGFFMIEAPTQAIVGVPLEQITPNKMSVLLNDYLKQFLPDNAHDIKITLYPEAIDGPYFHYSHGLKEHRGDCQRIAHGHRSRLEIKINGQHSSIEEEHWADEWRNIYLASKKNITKCMQKDHQPCYCFSYRGTQGEFTAILPQKCCYLIDTETTIELLTQHVAHQVKCKYPDQSIEVTLYEGLNKGCVIQY